MITLRSFVFIIVLVVITLLVMLCNKIVTACPSENQSSSHLQFAKFMATKGSNTQSQGFELYIWAVKIY